MPRIAALGIFTVAPVLGAVTLYQSEDQKLDDSVKHLFEVAGVEIEMKDPKDADVIEAIRALPLPWVFSCGTFVGGATQVLGLSVAGELANVGACNMGIAALPEAQQAPVTVSDEPAAVATPPPPEATAALSFLEPPPIFQAALPQAFPQFPLVGYPNAAVNQGLQGNAAALNGVAFPPLPIPAGYPTAAGAQGLQFGMPAANYGAYMPDGTMTYYPAPQVDYGMLGQNFGATPVIYAPGIPLQADSTMYMTSEYQAYAPYMFGR